jgi:phosphoribosyl 1,2-cyclic phosphate phosphodiesterase
MTREQIFDVDSVLITHTHADHVMGMDDLRSLCMKYGRDIIVYALDRYHADIQRIFPYAFRPAAPGVAVPRFDLRSVPDPIEVGGMWVETFPVDHGREPVVAIRVGDFAYMTDVSNIPLAGYPRLEGLKTLVIDAVRRAPHPNHFHFDRAVDEANKIGAETTYLTHLSHDYDFEATERELPSSIRLAYDGLRIPVKSANL